MAGESYVREADFRNGAARGAGRIPAPAPVGPAPELAREGRQFPSRGAWMADTTDGTAPGEVAVLRLVVVEAALTLGV